MSSHTDDIYDPAGPVLHKDVAARLDAIVRRQGGTPKSVAKPGRMVLPTPGRRNCEGQLPLVLTVREAREAETGEP